MSAWLDQIKHNMWSQLTKIYKDAKAKSPPEEWKEFETWFWKVRPHISVDVSKYDVKRQSETSGPNPNPVSESPIVPVESTGE